MFRLSFQRFGACVYLPRARGLEFELYRIVSTLSMEKILLLSLYTIHTLQSFLACCFDLILARVLSCLASGIGILCINLAYLGFYSILQCQSVRYCSRGGPPGPIAEHIFHLLEWFRIAHHTNTTR
jgi:hypothetical protein